MYLKKRYLKDCELYEKNNRDKRFLLSEGKKYIVYEDEEPAGKLDEHYFLQDIWMSKCVRERMPIRHYDVGSRIDGFIAHLLSMSIETTLIDIRKLDINVEELCFIQDDATELKNIKNETIDSLSALHSIEHFGLGRYGDNIDPDAWKKVLHSFERVLKKDGYLYLSVPIARKSYVVFNAHRVFLPSAIIDECKSLKLERFAYIDSYEVHELDVNHSIDENVGESDYMCGMFVFRKV